jgi:hypothetical protein
MTLEQRTLVEAALHRYGAHLTDENFIAKGSKVLSVRVDVQKGRLRMLGGTAVLASYPAARIEKGVVDFVQKFWFWKPSA